MQTSRYPVIIKANMIGMCGQYWMAQTHFTPQIKPKIMISINVSTLITFSTPSWIRNISWHKLKTFTSVMNQELSVMVHQEKVMLTRLLQLHRMISNATVTLMEIVITALFAESGTQLNGIIQIVRIIPLLVIFI